MQRPDIECQHAKFLKRLERVSRVLEGEGVQGAILASLRECDARPEVLAAAEARLGNPFDGLPDASEASSLARAAFVVRASQTAAGYRQRDDEHVAGAYRTVARLSVLPCMSEDGEFYTAVAECLSGRLAGRMLGVGKVSARWLVNYFIRNAGGRAFHKYPAADASGLFFTAWVDTGRPGSRMLESLSATGSQKAWNRRLLDARGGRCALDAASPCRPCPLGADACALGRWRTTLAAGACPVCGRQMPMLPGGVCLECVYNARYRRR